MSDEKTAQEIVVDTLSGIAGMLSEANRKPESAGTLHRIEVSITIWTSIERETADTETPLTEEEQERLDVSLMEAARYGLEDAIELFHMPEECGAGECRALVAVSRRRGHVNGAIRPLGEQDYPHGFNCPGCVYPDS